MDFLDFIRKVAQENRERGFVIKGGPGSGWHGPPKGTHVGRHAKRGESLAGRKEVRGKRAVSAREKKRRAEEKKRKERKLEQYTVGKRKIEEKQLLSEVISTQKELFDYERGKKLPIKPKKRLDRARDVLARARYAYLNDPERKEKMKGAAKVISAFETIGAKGIAFSGIPGITG